MEKRYHLFSEHLKRRFGGRVHKISVDAGLGCPNRPSGRQAGGCIFCDPDGSGAVGIARQRSIAEQIEHGKELMVRKYKAQQFMAYFQPFSNTFAPVEHLRALYDEALDVADVVGLSVGTRPDCLPPEVVQLLAEYHRRSYFWLELGLQSCHDQSLKSIERGHDYACFLRGYDLAKAAGLRVCVHLIVGLPGETPEQMLATIDEMARLKVDGVKLHLLHILKGTRLGQAYQRGEVEVLSQAAYVELVVEMMRRLHPETLIHRLTGDGPRDLLLAPQWSLKKWEVLNAIDAAMMQGHHWQGDACRTTAVTRSRL